MGFQKSIQGARGPTLLGLKSRPASPGIMSVNRATTLSAHIDNAIYASSEIPAQDVYRSSIADMAGVHAAAGATAIFLYETRIPRRVFGGQE